MNIDFEKDGVLGEDRYNPLAMQEFTLRAVQDDHTWRHLRFGEFDIQEYEEAFASILENPGAHILEFSGGTGFYDTDGEYVETYDEVNVDNFKCLSSNVNIVAHGRYAYPELNNEMDTAEKAAYEKSKNNIKAKAAKQQEGVLRWCVAEFCQRHQIPAEPEWQFEQAQLNFGPIERTDAFVNSKRELNEYYNDVVQDALDDINESKKDGNYPRCAMHTVISLMDTVSVKTIQEHFDVEHYWQAIGEEVVAAKRAIANGEKVQQNESFVSSVKRVAERHPDKDFVVTNLNLGIARVKAEYEKQIEQADLSEAYER